MALLDLQFLSKAQQVRIGSLRARHKVREGYRRRQLLERAQLPRGFRRLVQYQVQFAECHLVVLLRDGQLSLRADHFEVGLENVQLRHFTGLESRLCDLADAPRQIHRALLQRREGPRAGCRGIGLPDSAAAQTQLAPRAAAAQRQPQATTDRASRAFAKSFTLHKGYAAGARNVPSVPGERQGAIRRRGDYSLSETLTQNLFWKAGSHRRVSLRHVVRLPAVD